MALTDSLIFYLKADETSGAMVDVHGGMSFTESSGTIGATTGKVGGGRDFEAGDTESVSRAIDSLLQCGDIDLTIQFWAKLESTPSNGVAISWGWSGVGSTARVMVLYWPSGTQVRMTLGVGTGNVDFPHNQTFNNGQWYRCLFEHDSVGNTTTILIDNGTPTVAAHTTGMNVGSGTLDIGASPSQALYFDGVLDEIAFWKRKLTADEKLQLWNGGNGVSYQDILLPVGNPRIGLGIGIGI